MSITVDEPDTPDLPSVLGVYMLMDGYAAEDVDRLLDAHNAKVWAEGNRACTGWSHYNDTDCPGGPECHGNPYLRDASGDKS